MLTARDPPLELRLLPRIKSVFADQAVAASEPLVIAPVEEVRNVCESITPNRYRLT